MDERKGVQNINNQDIRLPHDDTTTSNEIGTEAIEIPSTSPEAPKSFILPLSISISENQLLSSRSSPIPLLLITRPTPLRIRSDIQPFQGTQKLSLSAPMCVTTDRRNQPPSLFMLALTRLNDSSISLAVLNRTNYPNLENYGQIEMKSPELTTPDSITSAPPSYSFVLRQMARRRPRLMGTFIPSPSFVQHTPPPNYATAFDIYVDNHIRPPPPPRVYNFGFTPMLVVCPECGYTGMTLVTSKITLCTHLCAITLCLLCCWPCAPLPYVLKSCKDVYHYCNNCRYFLGMYCPTNPEGGFP